MSNEFYNYLVRLNEYERKKILSDSLAVELTDFKNRWKKYAEEFQFPYKDLEVNLENHVIQINLRHNSNISFVGAVTNYKEDMILKSITMIASGDGSTQTSANMFIAMGILIASINPHESVEFRKNLLSDLGILELKDGTKNVVIVKKIKYGLNFSKELGLWFSVSRYN